MPLPAGKSHVIAMTPIGNELTKRGHTVHMLIGRGFHVPFQQETLKVIYYGSVATEKSLDYDAFQENTTRSFLEKKTDMKSMFPLMVKMADDEARRLLVDNENLLEQLDEEKYDLVVVDSLFFMKYAYLIPLRLRVRWVTYTDSPPPWLVRVPYLPSFVPGEMVAYTDRMTFSERFANTLATIAISTYLAFPDPPEEVVAKYKKYGEFSSMDDLISKSLLYITTNDIVLNYPTPSMPNVIDAGGLTVSPSDESDLPENFKVFMEAAKDGVILVTFGSMASSIPRDIAEKFISVFTRLCPDYRVIWRLNNKDDLELPDNVMVSRWVPQNNILAYKSVKLFITHCGNNGQFEAVYHAVPMIGFPLFGDQPSNAKRLEYKGYGIAMDIHSFTIDELHQNIMKILTHSSYRDRVKRASEIFRSNPDTPAEKAASGIEHVTKFGGDHLRSAGTDLYLYQYLLLDVLLVILVTAILSFYCFFRLLRFVCRKVRKTTLKSTKKNN